MIPVKENSEVVIIYPNICPYHNADVKTSDRFEEVVAVGAAIQGIILGGDAKDVVLLLLVVRLQS